MTDPEKAEYRRLIDSFKRTANIKECFYHDKEQCKGIIKQSHSIQRNGRLSIIEGDVNGNKSVYSFAGNVPSMDRVMEDLRPAYW